MPQMNYTIVVCHVHAVSSTHAYMAYPGIYTIYAEQEDPVSCLWVDLGLGQEARLGHHTTGPCGRGHLALARLTIIIFL